MILNASADALFSLTTTTTTSFLINIPSLAAILSVDCPRDDPVLNLGLTITTLSNTILVHVFPQPYSLCHSSLSGLNLYTYPLLSFFKKIFKSRPHLPWFLIFPTQPRQLQQASNNQQISYVQYNYHRQRNYVAYRLGPFLALSGTCL